ncbi:hypothetical protein SteCoe_21188 [Stentor coeruleus]|uniref:Uncharacterized protein n=1 Tax=Stentor coeruleus TaxID=5963 RepID=A0A1R2BQ65_9CILI|nr:hypothetical protein SteCoe_21188 [Stentor coeruleus]
MPATLNKMCYCIDLVTGCKIIAYIQFIRSIFALTIFLLYNSSQGMSLIAIHHLFRILYIVFLLFSICSLYAIGVLMLLYSRSINWKKLEGLYKSIIISSILWMCEYCGLVGILITTHNNPLELLKFAFPTFYCIAQDFYFSFCIYSCKVLAESGGLFRTVRTHMVFEASFGLVVQNNNNSVVIAEPVDKPIPPKTESIVVHDFTCLSQDKIHSDTNTVPIKNDIVVEDIYDDNLERNNSKIHALSPPRAYSPEMINQNLSLEDSEKNEGK